MKVSTADNLSAVSAQAWNAIAGIDNLFLQHGFLHALEQHDCLSPWGWQPVYFLVHDSDELVGACACYIKTNSYGEFVFDWAWADAYQRNNISYYPKLVTSIPFTPATGPRLLAKNNEPIIKQLLIEQIITFTREQQLSSAHWLFCENDDIHFLKEASCLTRFDYQYHWQNDEYENFDHFLSALNAKRRKNIKRERRIVAENNIELSTVNGIDLTEQQWKILYDFYKITFLKKSGTATFTLDFFQSVASQLHAVFAQDGSKIVAGAICYKNDTHLYGRHWGCYAHYDNLHFELCYYQGIDYCIENKLQTFEPGAQGEHKIWRGFLPTRTESAHYITHDGFRGAIEQFLEQEHKAMNEYGKQLSESTPYRCK